MSHENIQQQISQFLDNELPKEQLRGLFAHLAVCDTCMDFFTHIKQIHDASIELTDEQFPISMDRRFEVLSMGKTVRNNAPQTITFSMPSAILSGVLIIMMSLLLFLTVTPKQQSITQHPVDEQAMMMFQSIPSDHLER